MSRLPRSSYHTGKLARVNQVRSPDLIALSESGRSAFIVAYTDGVVDLRDEDLAIANLARAGRRLNRFYRFFSELIGHYHLELDFRKKVNRIFASPIKLGVPLLTAMAARFENGH